MTLWLAGLAAILLTPLGAFECDNTPRCPLGPAEELVGFWRPPRQFQETPCAPAVSPAGTPLGLLLVIAQQRVFAMYACEPSGELPDVWVCQ